MIEVLEGKREVHTWVDVSGNTFTAIQYVTNDPEFKALMVEMWEVDQRAYRADGLRKIEVKPL